MTGCSCAAGDEREQDRNQYSERTSACGLCRALPEWLERALFRLSAFFQRKRCPRCFARRPTGTNVGTSPVTSSFAISGQAASVSATLLLSGLSRGLEGHAALPNGNLAFFVAFARARLARSDTND